MTFGELMNKVGFQVDQSSVSDVNSAISNISNTAKKLLGAIGIGFSLTQLNALAEEFDGIGDRLNYASGFAENIADIQRDILDGANACRAAYGDFAEEVAALKTANADVFPLDEAAQFVEYLHKLGKSAGYSDGEISTMSSTIQRMIASGKVAEADLTRMLRSTPALAEQLAKALDTDVDGLKEMAAQGELTAETIRDAMKASVDDIDQAYANLNFGVGDALLQIRNKFGFWVDETNKMFNITQSIGKFMTAAFDKGLAVITRVRDGVASLSEKLGGAQNLMKLLAIAAAGVYVAMNFGKITSGLSSILKLITSIRLRVVALVAIIVALALAVDDFVNFMKGNNSVIGYMFEKAGIDAEAMRQKIVNIWNNLKTFFSGIWNAIKGIISPILDAIKAKIQSVFGDDTFASMGKGLAGVIETIEKVTQKLAENTALQEIIAKVAVAIPTIIALVSAFKKVSSAVKTVGTAIKGASTIVKGLSTAFSAITSPIGIVVAALAALAAAAYDFFNFMTGKSSVIGTIFEKLGIDADAVRQKVIEAWTAIKEFLTTVWNGIKSVADTIWGGIKAFFDEHGEQIKTALTNVWNGIQTVLTGIWNVISTVAKTIFGGLKNFFDEHGEQIKTALTNVWNTIKTVLGGVFNAIKSVATTVFNALRSFWETWGETILTLFTGVWETIQAVFGAAFDVIADLFAVFAALFAGDWETFWSEIKNLVSDIFNGILNIISTVLEAIWNVISSIFTTIWSFISETATNIWNTVTTAFQNMWNGIVETVSGIKDAVVEGFTAAIDWIKALPGEALQWGADIINGIVNGIKSAIGAVGEAVSSVASKIREFLHFSVPDTGPLADFESWMPDFMEGLAQGIRNGNGPVIDAIQSLVDQMAEIIQSAMDSIRELFADSWTEAVGSIGGDGEGLGSNLNSALEGIVEAYRNTDAAVKDSVESIFNTSDTGFRRIVESARENINQLPQIFQDIVTRVAAIMQEMATQATQWGTDIIANLISGIDSKLGELDSKVSEVAETVSSQLHFSKPDRGPLSNFDTYMPDMIDLMANGIKAGRNIVSSAAGDLAGALSEGIQGGGAGLIDGIRALGASAMPQASTIGSVQNSNNVNKSVVQNINFSNQFNGERAVQQKAAKVMSRSAENASTRLTRALAYAR